MALQGAVMNMALVYGVLQAATFFKLDDAEDPTIIRVMYYSSQVIGLLVLMFIRFKIKAKNDKSQFTHVEQKNLFDNQDKETITTTFIEYDLSQIKQQFSQAFIGLALITFLHFKFGYIRPLILQSILSLKTLYSTPLFQIYILGSPAVEGSLKRPWKQNPFGANSEEITPKQVKAKERKEIKKKTGRLD